MPAEKWKVSPKSRLVLAPDGTRFRKVGQAKTETSEDATKTLQCEPRSPHSAQGRREHLCEKLNA